MKRRKLIKHLKSHGCEYLREGGNHTIYVNRASRRVSAIPMKLKQVKSRRRKFDALLKRIKTGLPREFDRVTCPACGYPTLSGHMYDMCALCEWEDDYQDDPHANEVWGGPNADYSLEEARVNFEKYGGRGGMYRPEHDRDFQRVRNRFPRNRLLTNAYERLVQATTLEELITEIEKVRKVEDWPD